MKSESGTRDTGAAGAWGISNIRILWINTIPAGGRCGAAACTHCHQYY